MFLSHEQLTNSTYATFSRESKRFVVVKQLTTQSSTSLEDDQIQVADISQVCLEGTKQQLSNQLSNDQHNLVT